MLTVADLSVGIYSSHMTNQEMTSPASEQFDEAVLQLSKLFDAERVVSKKPIADNIIGLKILPEGKSYKTAVTSDLANCQEYHCSVAQYKAAELAYSEKSQENSFLKRGLNKLQKLFVGLNDGNQYS